MTCNKQLKKQVQDAARYYGASVSSYIRRLIKKEWQKMLRSTEKN